jgi:hypothetical protein
MVTQQMRALLAAENAQADAYWARKMAAGARGPATGRARGRAPAGDGNPG